jgi:hypothetical protein
MAASARTILRIINLLWMLMTAFKGEVVAVFKAITACDVAVMNMLSLSQTYRFGSKLLDAGLF